MFDGLYLLMVSRGSDRTDLRAIIVNGELIHVTRNLWYFLSVLLKSGSYDDVWFWADQISMDQRNVDERNHQVRLMSMIYQRAAHVFAYTGQRDHPEVDPRATMLKCAPEKDEKAYIKAGERLDTEESTLLHVISKDYWSRLWIVQELQMAKELLVWYGSAAITRSELIIGMADLQLADLEVAREN